MSDLYTIAVMLRGGQRQVNLIYQSKDAAEESWERLISRPYSETFTVAQDDYGSRFYIFLTGPIEALLFQDASRAQEAQIEMALLQARSQSKAQTRAQHDPMIKTQSQIVPGGGFVGRG